MPLVEPPEPDTTRRPHPLVLRAAHQLSKVHPKVTAATLGAALSAVTFGGIEWLTELPQPPGGVEAGATTLLTALFGWFKRVRS